MRNRLHAVKELQLELLVLCAPTLALSCSCHVPYFPGTVHRRSLFVYLQYCIIHHQGHVWACCQVLHAVHAEWGELQLPVPGLVKQWTQGPFNHVEPCTSSSTIFQGCLLNRRATGT